MKKYNFSEGTNMKPEFSNAFTFNTTSPNDDIIISFYHEWMGCEDGKNLTENKEKVQSVRLSIDNASELAEKLLELINKAGRYYPHDDSHAER